MSQSRPRYQWLLIILAALVVLSSFEVSNQLNDKQTLIMEQ